MRALTGLFENVAITLKPIGTYLCVMAGLLLFALSVVPVYLPLPMLYVLILISMWMLGLTLIYLCYCPGAASFLFIKWKTTSLLRRIPSGLHGFVNIFVLFLLIALSYASVFMASELVSLVQVASLS